MLHSTNFIGVTTEYNRIREASVFFWFTTTFVDEKALVALRPGSKGWAH